MVGRVIGGDPQQNGPGGPYTQQNVYSIFNNNGANHLQRGNEPQPNQGYNAMNSSQVTFNNHHVESLYGNIPGFQQQQQYDPRNQHRPDGIGVGAPPTPEMRINIATQEAFKYIYYSPQMNNIFSCMWARQGKPNELAINIFNNFKAYDNENSAIKEFDSALRMNTDALYNNVIVNVIRYLLVYRVGEFFYNHQGPINADKLIEFVIEEINDLFMPVLIMAFSNYIATHPSGWYMYNDLSPNLKRKLNTPGLYDELTRMIKCNFNQLGELPLISTVMNAWIYDLENYIAGKAPNLAPTVGAIFRPSMNPSHHNNIQDTFQVYNSSEGYEYESTAPYSNGGDSYTGGYQYEGYSKGAPKMIAIEDLPKYADCLHEVDFSQWLKNPRPGECKNRVVSPYNFLIIAKLFRPEEGTEPYDKYIYRRALKIPLVVLDMRKRTYRYVLVDVDKESDIEMILSNPEKIIPFVDRMQNPRDNAPYHMPYSGTLEEACAQKDAEENDKNAVKELDKKPTIIYANKAHTLSEVSRIDSTVKALHKRASFKLNRRVDAVALPFISTKTITAGVPLKELVEAMPFLVNGTVNDYDIHQIHEKLIDVLHAKMSVAKGAELQKWAHTRATIDSILTNVINRWVIESVPTLPFNHTMDSFIKDWPKFWDSIPYSVIARELGDSYEIEALVERLQFIGNEDVLNEHLKDVERSIGDSDLSLSDDEEYRSRLSVYVTKGMMIKFDKIEGFNPNSRKIFFRSSNPEILHTIETVAARGKKFFDAEVPVYIQMEYNGETVIWSAERSLIDVNSVVLTPMDTKHGIVAQINLVD